MNHIIIKNLGVERDEKIVLQNINLTIQVGEFVTIVGKSGSGKTTFLYALAKFLPFSGDITIPKKIGVIFQQYGVYPWMTVEKNISFGLHKFHPQERIKIVEEFLDITELRHKRHAYPAELSGGQVQRVAIARSIAHDPEVLLMDEPYSALDAHTRENMQQWLLRLWQQKQKTIIFVTHNIEEAIFLADRVLVLDQQKFVNHIQIPFTRPRRQNIKFTPEFNRLREGISLLFE